MNLRVLVLCFGSFLLIGCAVFSSPPAHVSTSARLSAFPVNAAPVGQAIEVIWDRHQIPMVVAGSDRDAAFALGMVHAHLRLGQMELYRRVVSGRLSEVAGPFAVDIDKALRLLNFRQAVPAMREGLSADTREFLEAFVDGINFYRDHTTQRPFEEEFLDLDDEPWTVEDVLGLSRLAGTEVNWLFWFRMLPLTKEPAWPEFWKRVRTVHGRSAPSFTVSENSAAPFGRIHAATDGGVMGFLGEISKSGSNSIAVSGRSTEHGAALLANDPHVGLQLPNLWLVAGIHSPRYRAVGLMFPGVPGILLGRNEHIAWGGTNMLSLTSSLYELTDEDLARANTEAEEMRVRWWFDESFDRRTVTIGSSPPLPVITDAPIFEEYAGRPLALRWRGYEPSDEIGAFLGVMRASTWSEFQAAFESYAVSGQNFLYADTKGNIGQLMAVSLPEIPGDFNTTFLLPSTEPWASTRSSAQLPSIYNPDVGFLVSANNQPFAPSPSLPRVGMFFSGNDRVTRLTARLADVSAGERAVAIEDLAALQGDTFSPSAAALQRLLLPTLSRAEGAVAKAIREWEGSYAVDSKGATAFTVMLFHLADALYQPRYGKELTEYILNSELVFSFLLDDLGSSEAALLETTMKDALQRTDESLGAEIPRWGEFHRVALQHPFGNVPILGRRFRYGELPGPGGATTVLKTFAGLTDQPHTARYGANSRHLSDLSDPDKNFFVLLGGQDGFFGSENFLDQVPLWQEGRTVQVPLRKETWSRNRTFSCMVSPERGLPCAPREH